MTASNRYDHIKGIMSDTLIITGTVSPMQLEAVPQEIKALDTMDKQWDALVKEATLHNQWKLACEGTTTALFDLF